MTHKLGPYMIPFHIGDFLQLIYELGEVVKVRSIEIIDFLMVDDKPCAEIDDTVIPSTETHEITEISQRHLKLKKGSITRTILRKSVIEEDV